MKQVDAQKQTVRDLYEDEKIFTYVVEDFRHKVIEASAAHYKLDDVTSLQNLTQHVDEQLQNIQTFIRQFHKNISQADDVTLPHLYAQKQLIMTRLHRVAGYVGQAITMSHWQSPAVDQSEVDNVGTLRGKILAYFNDYTRDMHTLGVTFEKAYRDQYIPIPHTVPIFTFATSSGMAAMTTAALFIQGETDGGNILIGRSCYFETKQLLVKLFGKRIHEIELSDPKDTEEAFIKYNPVAIFADTIGNEPHMRIVEIPPLLKLAAKQKHKHVYIVCDASANTLSTTYMHGFSLPKNVHILGVESQNKLLQFGLDRVTAGVVWGTGYLCQKLYDYRDHAGTICPDSTIATLPTPNRAVANLYTKRLERNTALLVTTLKTHQKIQTKKAWVIYSSIHGVYCILYWKQSLLHTYKRYIHTVMSAAKKASLPLVYGTSFGLSTTRIYAVAMHTQYAQPFLRIAAGSETYTQIQALGKLLSTHL